MKRGFYTIMAAQFFSSLADNALLVAAISLLRQMSEAAWMTPALKQSFVVSYVVLAPLVGAFADSMPKGQVMLITNGIKIFGCALMLFHVHPLAAYAVVGLGAAAYSPAKYGILTELLPPQQLVVANGWIEGTTVGSIILGVLLGGALVSPRVSTGAPRLRLSRHRHRHRHAARGRDHASSWRPTRSPRGSTGSSRTPASTTGRPAATRSR